MSNFSSPLAPSRAAQRLTLELSPPVRRAVRAAKALYPNRKGRTDPGPTPESLELLARAAGAPPAPLWARFGWFKSAVPGHRRGVWFHATDAAGIAVPPADRDSQLAFAIYCITSPPIRLRFDPPLSLPPPVGFPLPPLDPPPAPLGR